MRSYETLFILKPSLDEEGVNANIEKIKDVIVKNGGEIEEVDVWGRRKLAYPIDKVNEGVYTLINFKSDTELPKELTRIFRISDSVIRNIIVKDEK